MLFLVILYIIKLLVLYYVPKGGVHFMKLKRILALIGAVLLFAMYASTLIFAFLDHSATKGLLKASIACTILIPVLLYAYTLVYRVAKSSRDSLKTEEEDAGKQNSTKADAP